MKSTFFKSAVIAAALFASIGAAQAATQSLTLTYQIHLSPTKTVSLLTARTVSLKEGDRYVIDKNGVKHYGNFTDSPVVNTEHWRRYAPAGDNVFHNTSAAGVVDCVNSQSTIDWTATERQVINDGCAFQGNVKALTRQNQ